MASMPNASANTVAQKPAGNVNPQSLDELDPLLVFFPGLG
jgi:hypothetical protein